MVPAIIYMNMFNKAHVVRDENGKITGDKRWDVMNKDPKTLYTPALRAHTRAKIKTIRCPVLILQSDQHAITKFNHDVFVPELKALGIDTTLKVYPGEEHGFYWGNGKDLAKILQATRDADGFFQRHMKTTPDPIDTKHIKATKIPDKR